MRQRYTDMRGQRFGRVTVIEFAGSNENGNALWRCRCDCGTEFITARTSLVRGQTKSCGCYRAEVCWKNALIRKKR